MTLLLSLVPSQIPTREIMYHPPHTLGAQEGEKMPVEPGPHTLPGSLLSPCLLGVEHLLGIFHSRGSTGHCGDPKGQPEPPPQRQMGYFVGGQETYKLPYLVLALNRV